MNKVIIPGAEQVAGGSKDMLSQFGLNFEGVSNKRLENINDRIDRERAGEDAEERARLLGDDTVTQTHSTVKKLRYVDPVGKTRTNVHVTVTGMHKDESQNFDSGVKH